MLKMGVVLMIGAALGAATLSLTPAFDKQAAGALAAVVPGPAGENATLAERVAALEAALEQSARNQLDLFDQLLQLEMQLEEQLSALSEPANRAYQAAGTASVQRRPPRPADNASARPSREERRRQRLLDAGFDLQTVDNITRREGELRMEIMRQRYEATRGRELGPASSRDQLRDELGDEQYDRYLYATGRPNRVKINGVIPTSPGKQAGLREGDMILSYDGERVFAMNDIVRLSQRGTPGESVNLEIRRSDGSREFISLPRGPIGVWGGGGTREDPDK